MPWTRHIWKSFVAALLCGFAALPAGNAQGAAPLRTDLSGELASLASRAALIFTGQVTGIARHSDVVEISFRVDQPVFGTPGSRYTLREWAGFWPPGQFRYSVGQRALIFLHSASAAGFASPVGGAEGVVPLVVQGADAPQLLDIRRLAAATLREPGTPLPTEAEAAVSLLDAISLVEGVVKPAAGGHGRWLQAPLRFPFGRIATPPEGAPGTLRGRRGTDSPGEPLPVLRTQSLTVRGAEALERSRYEAR